MRSWLALLLLREVLGLLLGEGRDHGVDRLDHRRERVRGHVRGLLEDRRQGAHARVLAERRSAPDHRERPRTARVVVHLPVDLQERVVVEGALEEVPGVVGPEHAQSLGDGRDLPGAELLADGPLVGLRLAGRLRVREERLVPGVLALLVRLLLLGLRQALRTRAVLPGLVQERLLRRAELGLLRVMSLSWLSAAVVSAVSASLRLSVKVW